MKRYTLVVHGLWKVLARPGGNERKTGQNRKINSQRYQGIVIWEGGWWRKRGVADYCERSTRRGCLSSVRAGVTRMSLVLPRARDSGEVGQLLDSASAIRR